MVEKKRQLVGLIEAVNSSSSLFGAGPQSWSARVMDYSEGREGKFVAGAHGVPTLADAVAALAFHVKRLGLTREPESSPCFWILSDGEAQSVLDERVGTN